MGLGTISKMHFTPWIPFLLLLKLPHSWIELRIVARRELKTRAIDCFQNVRLNYDNAAIAATFVPLAADMARPRRW